MRLNPDKCCICVPEVSYFGHTLSQDGIKPDPHKVKAIREMQPPQSKAEMETVLCMINYLSRFAPHLSQVNSPLRQLLKQDSEFSWDANHDQAFQEMKNLITQHPGSVLSYCDPQKELRLQVDVSTSGVGAVMLQEKGRCYICCDCLLQSWEARGVNKQSEPNRSSACVLYWYVQ